MFIWLYAQSHVQNVCYPYVVAVKNILAAVYNIR